MKRICLVTAAVFLLAGCDDKVESKTVTKYATDKCAVDVIAGVPDSIVYAKPGSIVIGGWAFDDVKHMTSKDLRMRLTGAFGEPVIGTNPTRIDRPDVAKIYNNKALTESGFSFVLDTSKLSPGAYEIKLDIPDGNALFVCQPKKFVVII